MLVTGKRVKCGRCSGIMTSKERSRLHVETDASGRLIAVCPNCQRR